MKSLMVLWCTLAEEIGKQCCTSTARDQKTVAERFDAEGLAFLTLTLPQFGKDLERSLELGTTATVDFASFRKVNGVPVFLRGLLSRVFDLSSGELLPDADWECIRAVRQLTLMFAKILIECSDERKRDALESYVRIDQEVGDIAGGIPGDLIDLSRMAKLLFHKVFNQMDDKVLIGDIMCAHGPGNVSDGLVGNHKYDLRTYHDRLNQWFPFGDHGQPSPAFDYVRDRVNFLDPGSEPPVKVVLVPKTQKTPRVIAEESTCMMYVQQGISKELTKMMEANRLLRPLIGFTDQVPNQILAREGSLNGELATLDLSEASDRVSYEHVRVMLQDYPFLWGGVDAARTQKAHVLDEGLGLDLEISLNKFASMGSALCFPVEAMVFLSIVFLGIQDGLQKPLTRNTVKEFWGKVRVYGDDLIVPVDFVPQVIRRLESFGLKVNKDKSFWNGKFRESCGKDYFDGHDVSVTRVRRVFPSSLDDALETVSLVSLRNQLYYAGYSDTAEYLDGIIDPLLQGDYPAIPVDTDMLCYTDWVDESQPWRPQRTVFKSSLLGKFQWSGLDSHYIDPKTQIPLVKGWVMVSTIPAIAASGEGALLKYFLKRSDLPFADRKHLERSGRPKASSFVLRRQKVAIF